MNGQRKKRGKQTKMEGVYHLSFVSSKINYKWQTPFFLYLSQLRMRKKKTIWLGHDPCPAKQVFNYIDLSFRASNRCLYKREIKGLLVWLASVGLCTLVSRNNL